MATITINMNLAEWSAYMRRLGTRFLPAAVRGVQSGVAACIPLMQQRTDRAPPASDRGTFGAVNEGHYRQDWHFGLLPKGGRVYNSRPYSPVIDFGRRPRAVSKKGIENIERWAKNKLKLTGNEARSAAYAIAKTLERRPLRAREVMSGGIDEMMRIVQRDMQVELDRELGRK